MKQGVLLLGLVFLFFTGTAQAQNDNEVVLMTIGEKKVTRGEFERIYRKNNASISKTDKKSLEDYLELFINFKLKVVEAEMLGYDTAHKFKRELRNYRSQLAKPYLEDKSVIEDMIKESYERMKYEIRASHILLGMPPNTDQHDTLANWKLANAIRDSIIAGSVSFEDMAIRYSTDRSKVKNKGDLGYFSAFRMIYSFESAAYNLKIGDVSLPVRTKFGYHIIKQTDKRKARGKIKVAHIMLSHSKNPTPESEEKNDKTLKEIQQKIDDGVDFKKLAMQYSEDKGTSLRGGELNWFGTGRMVPEFEEAAFALEKNGDISAPVRSEYGWHIIKRIDKKGIEPFEKVKSDIAKKISHDKRSLRSKQVVIERIKKEGKFKEYSSLAPFLKVIDTTIVMSGKKWDATKAKHLVGKMFSVGDTVVMQQDFVTWIGRKKGKKYPKLLNNFLRDEYAIFVNNFLLTYEEQRLEKKYPEFKYLMKEYHDGLLLFDLSKDEIWDKASADSVGLTKFFTKNKKKYQWKKRFDISVYEYDNDETLKKTLEFFKKKSNLELSAKNVVSLINSDNNKLQKIADGQYEKGTNKYADEVFNGAYKEKINTVSSKKTIVIVKNKLPARQKDLSEAKGQVTADYQEYLEKKWVKALRNKYTVKMNKDVWRAMTGE